MPFHLHWPRSDPPRRPAFEHETADWIRAHRRPFLDDSVGSLVPVAFERYARLLHPARSARDAPVRWETVAAWSGRTYHALAQWDFLSIPVGEAAPGRPFGGPPATGSLRLAQLASLCDVLETFTTTPDRCFFGTWAGYGWEVPTGPASDRELRLDQRDFLVRQGPIREASRLGWPHPDDWPFEREPPTLIWPADRAWFVAGDVDLDSSYVGGSARLIEALLAHPDLEGWPADPADRISIDSDTLNVE